LDHASIEGLAVSFYERLGLDPADPVDTFQLARKLLGAGAIVRGTSLAGLAAKIFTVNGERRIAVNRKLDFAYAQHAVGHELGHVVCDEEGYRGEQLEQVCDAFGAAVMAPLPAVRAMLRAFGRDHVAIADEVCTTQTWAALRVAECLGIPRAIITPRRVYVRGPEEFVWGPDDSLWRLVRIERPGITKVRLTDDPRRVVLDVDELEVDSG
jgi:hypothetical protein